MKKRQAEEAIKKKYLIVVIFIIKTMVLYMSSTEY